MKKKAGIVRYTAEEIEAMRRRGEDRTDTARLDAMSEAEIEAAIDEDDEGSFDWCRAEVGFPGPKQQLTVRFDREVIDWFKSQGRGYQTRMNAVLRSYIEAKRGSTR